MTQSTRLRPFSIALLIAMLFAAALPVAAFADEGEPPPAPTEAAPSAEDDAAGEQTGEGETSIDEESPTPELDQVQATEEAPVNETATSEPDAEAEAVAETEESFLADIPADTELVVLDEAGNPVPLASAEAAEIIAVVDPIWCPTGITPGGAGCSSSFPDLLALVLGFVPTGNGVIWIQAGADGSASDILINGLGTWSTAQLYSLELKGGWNGTLGSTVTNPLTPSTLTQKISITNWLANVTLSDITITGDSGVGLTIKTTKNIVLTRVSSNNNTGVSGRGAELDNATSISGNPGTGSLTVTNGIFSGNANAGGLYAASNGNITLNVVTANSNGGSTWGAYLDNSTGTGNVSVITGNFISNANQGGLFIYSDGTITLNFVAASGNTGTGATIDNSTAATAKNVTISGSTSQFSSNTAGGLVINSKGAISLSNVNAQSNSGGVGASMGNVLGTLGVTISTSNFSANTSTGGLFVISNGAITLSGVTSNSNTSGYGASVDNDSGNAAVSITNSNFNNNVANGGLTVNSKGTITLTSVNALGNLGVFGKGAYLVNTSGTGNISVSTSTFTTNVSYGLHVFSNGTVTLTGVVVNGNGNYGAFIDNSTAATAKNVTVAGTNNQFNLNTLAGLNVLTKGSISLANLIGSNNTNFGAYLNAVAGTGTVTITNGVFNQNIGSGGGVYVLALGNITLTTVTANQNSWGGSELDNTPGTGNIAVTTGVFNLNGGDGGLKALSNGTITLTNVTANGNTGGYGARLDNTTASSAKTITLNGANEFSSNRNTGLNVTATGAITLNNVTANYNGITGSSGSGAALNNTIGTAVAGVTVNGTNFFAGNYSNGLSVSSDGFIKLNSIIANSNSNGNGAYLVNTTASPAQPVTITGTNEFKFNSSTGLVVYSNGLISLNNITANSNGPAIVNGAYLDNSTAGNTGGITITGVNVFNNNGWGGLNVHSRGPISVSNVTANENGLITLFGGGVSLINHYALTHQPVTVSGVNTFIGNRDTGLSIATHGAITVNSITSTTSVNSYGVILDNTYGFFSSANLPITMNGTNVISNNFYTGLNIGSYGNVTLNNVTALGNGVGAGFGNGVAINNASADTPKTVTINGINNISDNDDSGLDIETDGAIKINSLTANDNGSSSGHLGADLTNNGSPSNTGGITLTGTNSFNNNSWGGLRLQTNGPIALNSVTASGNLGSYGVQAYNYYGGTSSPQSVTLTGTNVFNNNYTHGLDVFTYGAISVNNVTATSNGTSLSSGYGVKLWNSNADPLLPLKGVTISGTNVFSNNYNTGLLVSTLGAITGNNITAINNGIGGTEGVYLFNSSAPSPTNVTLTGTNVMSTNDGNGLTINTDGVVTLNSITANGNGTGGTGSGLILYNYYVAGKNVTITGTNAFNSNDGTGLLVYTRGVISLTNVTASSNLTGLGADLDNTTYGPPDAVARPITLGGVNNFNSNGATGLSARSNGAISLSSATANGNTGYGAYLENNGSPLPQGVTLVGLNKFNANQQGLYINTKGAVTSATGLSATNSTSTYGAQITNSAGDGTAVTLGGTNTFTGNNNSGLTVQSEGAITINSITATGNGVIVFSGFGVVLDNDGDPLKLNNVTVSGINNFSGNYTGGLLVASRGNISLASATASNTVNGAGAELVNVLTAAKTVTLSGTNTFSGNNLQGLIISSQGVITLNNITASLNGIPGFNAGAVIENNGASSAQFVKLNGTNVFNENGATGLVINSKGAITTNNVSANENGGLGAFINNSYLGMTGGVTMTGVNNFIDNGGTGMQITSHGVVSLSKVTADNNGLSGSGNGLYVSTDGNVTLTCGWFASNDDVGLSITTLGTLTLKGVISAGNNPDYSLFYGSLVNVRTC